jgi:hypothetical protein
MESELHRRAAEMERPARSRRRSSAAMVGSPELVEIEAGIDAAFRELERERRSRRPVGVSILALCYLSAGFCVLALVAGFVVFGVLGSSGGQIAGGAVVLGLIGLVGWLIMRGGLRMWRLHPSGWAFGAVTALIVAAVSVVALVDHAIAGTLGQTTGSYQYITAAGLYGGRVAVSALTVWYLFRPRVLGAFGVTPEHCRRTLRRSALVVACAGAIEVVLRLP